MAGGWFDIARRSVAWWSSQPSSTETFVKMTDIEGKRPTLGTIATGRPKLGTATAKRPTLTSVEVVRT